MRTLITYVLIFLIFLLLFKVHMIKSYQKAFCDKQQKNV